MKSNKAFEDEPCLNCGHKRRQLERTSEGLRLGPCTAFVFAENDEGFMTIKTCPCARFVRERKD